MGAICRNPSTSSGQWPWSCFWSWWINPGTGRWGGQKQPPLLGAWKDALTTAPHAWRPVQSGGRMQLPSSSGKFISAHGENCFGQQDGKKTAKTGYGGLIFLSCLEIRVALGCSRWYDLQKVIWCLQEAWSVIFFINLACRRGKGTCSDSGFYCCGKPPIKRAKQIRVISLNHRNER